MPPFMAKKCLLLLTSICLFVHAILTFISRIKMVSVSLGQQQMQRQQSDHMRRFVEDGFAEEAAEAGGGGDDERSSWFPGVRSLAPSNPKKKASQKSMFFSYETSPMFRQSMEEERQQVRQGGSSRVEEGTAQHDEEQLDKAQVEAKQIVDSQYMTFSEKFAALANLRASNLLSESRFSAAKAAVLSSGKPLGGGGGGGGGSSSSSSSSNSSSSSSSSGSGGGGKLQGRVMAQKQQTEERASLVDLPDDRRRAVGILVSFAIGEACSVFSCCLCSR